MTLLEISARMRELGARALQALDAGDTRRSRELRAEYEAAGQEFVAELDATNRRIRQLQAERAETAHRTRVQDYDGRAVMRLLDGIDSLPADDTAARYRAHVEALGRSHGIELRFALGTRYQAYALPGVRAIEAKPIGNPWDYATVLHEIGHVIHPCTSAHIRVPRADEPTTLCVRCEIDAWRFAIREARDWGHLAAANMAVSLGSYRSYGTPAEQREIDEWLAPGSRLVRLERLAGPAMEMTQ